MPWLSASVPPFLFNSSGVGVPRVSRLDEQHFQLSNVTIVACPRAGDVPAAAGGPDVGEGRGGDGVLLSAAHPGMVSFEAWRSKLPWTRKHRGLPDAC